TFTSALQDAGIDAEAAQPAASPQDATELASVDSAPVSQMVEFMLVNSDNVVAEVLGREVALATGPGASAEESPAAVIDALAAQDVDTGSITLEDTSGLDYDNRISAHDLTTIVQASAQAQGDLSLLIPAMPVGGLTGTLFDRYRDEDSSAGAGVVHRSEEHT